MRHLYTILTTALKRNRIIVTENVNRFTKIAFNKKYLLLTNVVISISLSSVGDVLEQRYEILTKELDQYSVHRTKHMAISGAIVGVGCHFWYQILDKHLPGRSFQTVVKKVMLDQLICSPIMIALFFLTLGILEKSNQCEILNEIKGKAWRLYVAEWVVWPPAQFINFYWLPTRYRVFYDNTISLGYDVYTSKVKHTKILENKCINVDRKEDTNSISKSSSK